MTIFGCVTHVFWARTISRNGVLNPITCPLGSATWFTYEAYTYVGMYLWVYIIWAPDPFTTTFCTVNQIPRLLTFGLLLGVVSLTFHGVLHSRSRIHSAHDVAQAMLNRPHIQSTAIVADAQAILRKREGDEKLGYKGQSKKMLQ